MLNGGSQTSSLPGARPVASQVASFVNHTFAECLSDDPHLIGDIEVSDRISPPEITVFLGRE